MTKTAAVLIDTDGGISWTDIGQPEAHLQLLQTLVGGWVQAVDLTPDLTLWVNEEGKLNGLPVNEAATRVWKAVYGPTDVIVGPAVLTGGADEDGELVGLTRAGLGRLDGIIPQFDGII